MARNWAIAIGINQYELLQPLRYAKADALSIHQFLVEEAKFDCVLLFTDDSPPVNGASTRPSRSSLRRWFANIFDQPFLGDGDNFWFFFSGHGIRHGERDYLMPLDGDPQDVAESGIAVNEVTERLRRSGADNVVLILDACRNLATRSGAGIGAQTAQQSKQTGVISIFSCSPNQYSYEIEPLQQGAFTKALLEGLGIQERCATVERLNQYLEHRVPEIVSSYYPGSRQNPYTIAEPISKSHLILMPQYRTLQDAATLKLDAYKAETERDFTLAEQLWIRVLAVSSADMDAIAAIKRIAHERLTQPGSATTPPPNQGGKISSTGTNSAFQAEMERSPSVSPSESPPQTNPSLLTFEFDAATRIATTQSQPSGFLGLGSKLVTEFEIQRTRKQAKYYVEDLGNGVNLEMVAIPSGTFQMGSPEGELERSENESPQHSVTVPPFFMGKFAVTQAQWRAIAALPKINLDLDPDPSYFKGDDRPVERVSWHDAMEWCDRLSRKTNRKYRLPSEAEWEYACRAGTATPFHFGETITTDLANYNGEDISSLSPKGISRKTTTPVGSFKVANAFGLFDMHGNVWEWCADHWHKNYQGAPKDESVWMRDNAVERAERLLRGGSWDYGPGLCRSAYRDKFRADYTYQSVGFRLVCPFPWTE